MSSILIDYNMPWALMPSEVRLESFLIRLILANLQNRLLAPIKSNQDLTHNGRYGFDLRSNMQ